MPEMNVTISVANQSKGIRVSGQVMNWAFPRETPEEVVDMFTTRLIATMVDRVFTSEARRLRQDTEAGITIQD